MKHVPLSTLNKVVAIACFALAGSALAVPAPPVCPDTGVSQLTTDLTAPGDTTTIGGSIFTAVDTNGSVGTGSFPSFYKVQGNGCIQGYNTDGVRQFDTQAAPLFTFLLNTTDVVTVGTTDYVEFHLDINQDTNNPGLSLDNVEIFASTSDTLTGWTADCKLGGVDCLYNMDAGTNRALLMTYVLNKGSGNGYDMQLLLPVSVFAGLDASTNYVYLYSSFGAVGGASTENDGFEEWAYRRCPEGQTCWKTPEPDPNPAPEPGTLALIAIAMVGGALGERRRRTAKLA